MTEQQHKKELITEAHKTISENHIDFLVDKYSTEILDQVKTNPNKPEHTLRHLINFSLIAFKNEIVEENNLLNRYLNKSKGGTDEISK